MATGVIAKAGKVSGCGFCHTAFCSVSGIVAMLLGSASAIARDDTMMAGLSRSNTLIVDELWSPSAKATQMNPYHEGVTLIQGLDQLVFSPLWEIDSRTHTQFPDLAATMPEPVPGSNTVFRFEIRSGLTWSDGIPFTAHDVVFSIQMLSAHKQLGVSNYLRSLIKRVEAVDASTVEIETYNPTFRLAQQLGVSIANSQFRIVPKHIWEGVNPVTYSNYPPIGIGPYQLQSATRAAVLWRRRDDWQHSDVGRIVGKPVPEYILFRKHEPENVVVGALLDGRLDLATSLSPSSLAEILTPGSRVAPWSRAFPWGNMDDPCSKGIHFNIAQAPFDRPEVRWALALSINLQAVSISAFDGLLRAGVLEVPPTAILTELYYRPMLDWLESFALEDGYHPFDSTYPKRMASTLQHMGVADAPTDRAAQETAFGLGWWRYDRKEAAKLLTEAGFSKPGRQWQTPDGKEWALAINAPEGFEILPNRLAHAVAEQWQQFGIRAEVVEMPSDTFFESATRGLYSAGAYWAGSCAMGPDIFDQIGTWHSRFFVPPGAETSYNRARYRDKHTDELLDELAATAPGSEAAVGLGIEVLKAMVAKLPSIQMFGTTQIVPYSSAVWTNLPSKDNPYAAPWWWWTNFKFILPHLKQATVAGEAPSIRE
jgi:peptide/nickel transport system substrate-binding protein